MYANSTKFLKNLLRNQLNLCHHKQHKNETIVRLVNFEMSF